MFCNPRVITKRWIKSGSLVPCAPAEARSGTFGLKWGIPVPAQGRSMVVWFTVNLPDGQGSRRPDVASSFRLGPDL